MNRIKDKNVKRFRRKKHIRKNLSGTSDRPRMTVFKSNKHLYVQVVNDDEGKTLLSASTIEKGMEQKVKKSLAGAEKLGEVIGKRLKDKKIGTIVFDRNGYKYHGLVKAVADGARKAGIQF